MKRGGSSAGEGASPRGSGGGPARRRGDDGKPGGGPRTGGGRRPERPHRPGRRRSSPPRARLRRGLPERPERGGRLHRSRRPSDSRPRSDRRDPQRASRSPRLFRLPRHRSRAPVRRSGGARPRSRLRGDVLRGEGRRRALEREPDPRAPVRSGGRPVQRVPRHERGPGCVADRGARAPRARPRGRVARPVPRRAGSRGLVLYAQRDRRDEAAGGRHRRGHAPRAGGGRSRPGLGGPRPRAAPQPDRSDRPRGGGRPPGMGDHPMKFGMTANPHIPSALEAAKQVLARLEPTHDVLLESDLGQALNRKGMPLAHMRVDVVLAIGGDGTILRALQLSDTKVLGINSGSLGFLAEGTSNDADAYLERIARGDYKIEAVVHTAQIAKIRHFEIRLDDEIVERVRADGMIVATPTGSTSYSMSAGGPIVDPRVDAIIATAIAPFKPASRPHVFPAKAAVHVRLVKPKECLLVMDGQHESTLKGTEDVVLTGSERRAKLVRFRDDFYRRIEEKLSHQ